jgi:hypothetical protein
MYYECLVIGLIQSTEYTALQAALAAVVQS